MKLCSSGSLLAKIWIYFFLACTTASSASVIYGMGSHVGQGRTTPEQIWAWLTDANFRGTRDEIYWGDVEKEPGVFSFTKRAKTSLETINTSVKRGFTPLVVLDYGNRIYDEGDLPYTDNGRAAFARYSSFIASSVAPEVMLFEVWNEWNIGMGSKPRRKYGSPEDYVKLTAEAARAVKQAKPNSIVIGGSLADDLGDWPWLRQAISFGLLNHVDGISVHMYNYYNSPNNGGDAEFMKRLHQLEQILQKTKPKSPPKIYITEIGWPNHSGKGSVTPEVAADTAVRFLFASREIKTLGGIWFYELMDGGSDPNDKEHHFGALTLSGTDKPLSCALKRLGPFIDSLTPVSSKVAAGARVLTTALPDKTYITAIWQELWNADRPIHMNITSKNAIQRINLACIQPPPPPDQTSTTLNVTHSPIVLKHRAPLNILSAN